VRAGCGIAETVAVNPVGACTTVLAFPLVSPLAVEPTDAVPLAVDEQGARPGSTIGFFATESNFPSKLQLELLRFAGSETLTLVVGVSSPDSGIVVVAVNVRPRESHA